MKAFKWFFVKKERWIGLLIIIFILSVFRSHGFTTSEKAQKSTSALIENKTLEPNDSQKNTGSLDTKTSKKIEQIKNKLLETPEPAPKSVSIKVPKPEAKIFLPSRPGTSELVLALTDTNGDIAKEAALQLIRRNNAIEPLVTLYADNTGNIKQRSLWCLRRMGEPARIWFNQVLSHKDYYHPKIIVAVREILGEFEDEALPAKSSSEEITKTSKILEQKISEEKLVRKQIQKKKEKIADFNLELKKICQHANRNMYRVQELRANIASTLRSLKTLCRNSKALKEEIKELQNKLGK